MKKLFQALALLAAFVLLIALPQTAADGVRSALTLCGRVILPSLFPFFVCSNLFLLLGYSARLSARFGGAAAKLLRLPPAAGSAFLLGLLGGYPAGAQAAGTLYARGELSGANAERALAVCNQAGPSFIFGVLGGAVFKSAAAGAFLYAVQIVSAVLVCRLTAKKQYAPAKAVAKPPQPESFAAAFSESVRRAGMSAIQICMFITVFSVLTRYFLLAAGRFLPPEALPAGSRIAGAVRGLRSAGGLRTCASMEAVHRVGAFVLRRRKRSGAEPRRRAGARPDREAAPAMQGASGRAFLHAYAHRRAAAARGKLARRRLFRHARPGNGGSGVFAAVLGEPAAFSQKVP